MWFSNCLQGNTTFINNILIVTLLIIYFYHTNNRKNPLVFQELENGNLETLEASNFQLDKPLTMFSHGWSDMPNLVNAPELVAGNLRLFIVIILRFIQ